MKINYIKNLEDTLIACNREAYLYKDGKAWDNKKKKTYRKHAPRGKVYRKLSNLEGRKQYEKLVNLTSELQEFVNNKINPCACLGPQYGEPYCLCTMQQKGLPLNEEARLNEKERAEKQFEQLKVSGMFGEQSNVQ